MNDELIPTMMSLWHEGLYSDAEVMEWADKQILDGFSDPDNYMIELALNGPSVCSNKPSYEFPSSTEISFKEKFSIRLIGTDLKSDQSIKNFILWAASEAMGEDLESAEVKFSYELEHRLSYDEDDPIEYFKDNFHAYIEECEMLVTSMKLKANK